MASFDPSIISQIPDYAPNPMEARAKAFKLADLMTQEQSNKLVLEKQKGEMAEQQRTKDIFSKGDPTTTEGRMKLAGEFSKAGLAKPAMDVLKFSGEQQEREQQLQEGKIKLLQFASDVIGPEAYQIKQVLQTQGLPMAQAMYARRIAEILPQLPPGAQHQFPPQLPNDPQQAAQLLDGAVMRSQQARQMIAMEYKRKGEERAEQREGRQERDELRKEAKESDRKREQTEGIISDDAAQLAVDRILNGEQARDVLANFGRGKQGPQNIAKVQNLLASSAKARGISPQEVSARMVEFKGLVKEQQVEAGIAGRISYAEQEIQRIGPKVLEVANKIGRGSFVPWNKLQNLTASQLSDPNLKQLKAYLNTLTNSYDVLGGRGGTDVEKRAHNRALLDAADSPAALKAAVDAIVQEAQLSGEAAASSMTVDRGALGGRRPVSPSGASPGAASGGAANDPLGIR